MAEGYNLGNAYGKVIIDASGVRTAMDQARSVFAGGIQAIGGHIRSLGDQMSSIGSNLTVLTAPIAAFGVAGVKAAMDFDSALREIEVRTGSTTEAMEQVRQKSLDIGRDTSFSAGQAASAFLQLLTTGQSLEEAMLTIDAVMSGAAASGADLGYTADALTDIMAMFGLEASDAAVTMDALSQASGVSSATMTDLIQGFQNVGGVAHQFGLSVDDTAAALAVLSENGIKGAEAGTALRSMLNNMTRDTSDVTEVWKRLGISMFDAMGNARPLEDVLSDLREKLVLMSDEARIEVLKTLGGTFGQQALAALALGDGMDVMKGKMDGAATATEVAAGRMDTFKGSLLFVKGSIETLQIKVLTPFMNNTLKPLVQRIGEIINAISNWIDANPELAQTIVKVLAGVTALGPALFAGGKFMSAFGGIISSVGAALGLLLSPVGLVMAAVAGLGYAFATNFMGIRDILQPAIQYIRDAFQILLTGDFKAGMFGGAEEDSPIVSFFLGIRDGVIRAFSLIKTAIRDGIDGIKLIITGDFKRGMFGGAAEDSPIASFFLGIHHALENTWNNLKELWNDHLKLMFDEIGKFLGKVFENVDMGQVMEFASSLWALLSPIGRIQTIFKALGVDVGQVLRDIIDGITRFFETLNSGGGIGEALGAAFGGGGLGEGIGGFLGGMIDTLQNTVIPAVQGFVSWFTGEALPAIVGFIQDTVLPALQTFANWFIQDALPTVVNFVQTVVIPTVERFVEILAGIWELVRPGLETLGNWFINDALPVIISTVGSFISLLEGIWETVGPALEQLARWFIEDALPTVLAFISETVIPAINEFINILKGIWEIVGPVIQGLVDWFVTEGWPIIKGIIDEIIIPAINGLIQLFKDIWEVVGPVIQGLVDWFQTTGWPAIKKVIDEIITPAIQGVIDILSGIWDTVSPFLDALKSGLEGVFNWIKNHVIQPFLDVVNGIVGAVQSVVDEVNRILGNAETGIQQSNRVTEEELRNNLTSHAGAGAGASAIGSHDYPGMGRAGVPYNIGVPEMFAMANGGQILFMPPSNGQFTPLDQGGGSGGGGGNTYNTTIQLPEAALRDPETAKAVARDFAVEFHNELRRKGMK